MANDTYYEDRAGEEYLRSLEEKEKPKFSFVPNIIFFILTFISTTFAGVQWMDKDPFQLNNFHHGLTYAALIMLVITAHEFGHYFAALYHKVKVTLPYYIPVPSILFIFGTMGAVIRMKQFTFNRKALFDIAASGPIAGWVVSLILLIIGFATLPSIDYLYSIHPGYITSGISSGGLNFGYNIVYGVLEKTLAHGPNVFIPPMNEMYHYPFLCVGWFGMLITALNMMPAGQLDGGHIAYTMFGSKISYILSYTVFILLLIFGIPGLIDVLTYYLDIPFSTGIGSVSWFVWAILLKYLVKIKHPPIVPENDPPLDKKRVIIGWFTFFIFIVSFTPMLIY